MLLAQRTGDRTRDVPEAAQERVARWLTGATDADRLRELLLNPESDLLRDEQSWILGESLPAGLALFAPATKRPA